MIMSRIKPATGKVLLVLVAGLISPARHAGCQDNSAKTSTRLEQVECSSIGPLMLDHKHYLEYEKARELRADQEIAKFDWYRKPAPSYQPDPFDPLREQPIGASPFAFEKKLLKDCKLPAGAGLDEAIFHGSDLTGSTFSDAHLKNASFDTWKSPIPNRDEEIPTILLGVTFAGGDLTGASFVGADMTGVIFEPKELPSANDISEAKNLQLMTYDHDPSALSSLRQLFRDGGFALQDSEINYAINQRKLRLAAQQCESWRTGGHATIRSCLPYVGSEIIDWTCQFGLNLWRPVQIGIVAWLLFSVLFFLFMHHSGPSGLYLAVAKGIVLEPDAIKGAPQVRSSSVRDALKSGQLIRWVFEELRLLRIAMFFSLADSTTKRNGKRSGRWMGWGSILEAVPPSKVCQECATAISSKKNDTKSLPFKRLVGRKGPLQPSWGGMCPASAAS